MTVMPIVFPDGTTAELVYPPEFELETLPVRGDVSSALATNERRYLGLQLVPSANYADSFAGATAEACYETSGGTVAVLWSSPKWKGIEHIFEIPVGDWSTIAWEYRQSLISHRDRATWARSLVPSEHENGWAHLDPGDELVMGADLDGSVELALGSPFERGIFLWPIQCRGGNSDSEPIGDRLVDIQGDVGGPDDAFGSWCMEEGPMEIHVYNKGEEFIRRLAVSLTVRNVRHAADPEDYAVVP